VEDRDLEALLAEFGGAREASGAGAEAGDTLGAFRTCAQWHAPPCVVIGLHGETLEAPDFDWLFFALMHDAGAFAEDFDRADAGAACAQNIRLQDRAGRSSNIARRNLLVEPRHID